METIKIIFSNYYINVAFLSWLTAQVLKTLLTFVLTKEVVWERMVGAGGMPSAHSALVCSLTVALRENWDFLHRNLRFRLPLLPSLCMMRWVCAGQPESRQRC